MKEMRYGIGEYVSRLIHELDCESKLAFITTFIIGMCTHVYCFTNRFINNDEVNHIFMTSDSIGWGRWLLKPIRYLCSEWSLPWINGLFSILMLAIISYLIVKVLCIRDKMLVVLIGASIVTFPSVAVTFSYMADAQAYFVAAFFSVLAVFITDKYKHGFIIGIILIMLSLGIYQAYFPLAVALFAVRGMQILLLGETEDRLIINCVSKYGISLGGGIITYGAVTKMVLFFTGRELKDYQGIGDTLSSFDISIILQGIKSSYYEMFLFFTETTQNYIGQVGKLISIILGCTIIFEIIILFFIFKRTMLQKFMIIFIMLSFPIWLNSMHLMGAKRVHHLMILSLCSFYILAIMLADISINKAKVCLLPRFEMMQRVEAFAVSSVIAVCILLSSFFWGIFANKLYLGLEFKYDNTYALCLRLIDRIEQLPEYIPEQTEICFIGEPSGGNFSITKPLYSELQGVTGFWNSNDYTYIASNKHIKNFCQIFIGVNLVLADKDKIESLEEDNVVKEMGCFPEMNSVKFVDDVLVVKLGEKND